MLKKVSIILTILLIVFTFQVFAYSPNSTIEIIAPGSPGGGYDMTARLIEQVLKEKNIVENNIRITNKPGAGGSIGLTYLKGKEGSGNSIAVTSSLLLANNILGKSKLHYKDFTPLACLTSEWEVVVVRKESPYKTGKQFLEDLKESPSSLTIGVGPSLGNDDHISLLQICDEYGVDVTKLNFAVYGTTGGELITNLLGGHTDAVTTSITEAYEQIRAGNLRVLGISSPKRVSELPNVPTWKEQGIDVVFPHWRGIVGPPGMTKEQIEFWKNTIEKMTKTDKWNTLVKNHGMSSYVLLDDEFENLLSEQNKVFEEMAVDAGLVE